MILPLRRYKMIILGKIRKIYHPYLPLDTIIRKPFRIDGGKQLLIGKSVIFQSGTWLFCGSTVNSHGRLEIGENSVIGAGTVVTKSVLPKQVVAGNPNKILKHL
jgi:acetyltransferase-like isoleucine patch superfamily enzyme